MIDPRTWKREHKIALLLAIVLGAALGAWVGGRAFAPSTDMGGWTVIARNYCGWHICADLWFVDLPPSVVGWSFLGAVMGGVLVYIRQLLRA